MRVKRNLLSFFLLFIIIKIIINLLWAQEKIDLNRATLEDLERLPGIGKKIAQRILEYRERVGGFKNLDELKNVKGIEDKKLKLFKNYLSIGHSEKIESPYKEESRTIYQYKDEKGIIHFTQFPEMVPEKYRKSLNPLK